MKEILLFNKALKKSTLSFKEVNEVAIKYGYIVSQECCNERVLNFFKTLPLNVNSTFYKTWDDITSKNRVELLIDQLIHYNSTYGTEFKGEPYILNNNPEIIKFKDYKIILPISVDEIKDKIQSLFNSGIALKQETIDDAFFLTEEFDITLDLETIKNKEVLMFLYKKLGKLPSKPEEMVRFLVYLYTNKTLLIKDNETIRAINSNKFNCTEYINKYGVDKLSSVFYRFKPLFLAMKQGNEPIINKLRRLAVKNHKPYEFSYFEKLLSGESDLSQLEEKLEYLSNYKKVNLLQTIKIRQKEIGILPILVRNQKLFIKEQKNVKHKNYYAVIYDVIYNSLVSSLKKKACTVKLNPIITLAIPTSEKSFIGNVPFGSYVELGKVNSVVGINWKSAEGAQDLDLSLVDANDNKIGWNSSYQSYDQKIVYSGDMTYADPEATELMYCKKGLPDSIVKVNLFSGQAKSKLTIFFAKTDDNFKVETNKMVDPNDIIFSTSAEMTSKEMVFGIVIDNKFQFANIRTGNKIVSNGDNITNNFIKYSNQIRDCYLDLSKVLMDAGFTFVEKDPTIDLSILEKTTLIELFS